MFNAIFKLELKKLLTKWNLIVFGGLFILLALFCMNGISNYNGILKNKEPFQKLEQKKVRTHLRYTAYGTRGVRLLFIPSPFTIIFNDASVFSSLTAQVDTGEGLFISKSFKGKELFSIYNGYMDFSGIMILIGSFIALIYGFNANRNKEYIEMLISMNGVRNPIFLIILVRIILLSLALWALSIITLVWLLINSIPAANGYYMAYVLVLTIVYACFLLMGAAIGAIKGRRKPIYILGGIYFLFIFLFPWLVQKIIYIEANTSINSIYDLEFQTYNYQRKFEDRCFKLFGIFKSGKVAPETIKEMVRSGQDNEYMEIKRLENERFENISALIKKFQSIASFIPTTFYFSTNKELSSRGFQGFMNFYRYAHEMKYKFLKFFIDKKFYHDFPKTGVESFIKGDEDIFYSESQLPENFDLGIAINIIWLICLSVLNWFLFDSVKKQKYLDSLQEPAYLSELEPKEDAINAVITSHRDDYSKYIERLRLQNLRFLAIPDWHTLTIHSDIKVQWIFQLYNKPVPEILEPLENHCFQQLEPEELAMIYAELARDANAKIILFNDFAMGLSDNFIKGYFSEFLTSLKEGRTVVYFSRSIDLCSKFVDKVNLSPED